MHFVLISAETVSVEDIFGFHIPLFNYIPPQYQRGGGGGVKNRSHWDWDWFKTMAMAIKTAATTTPFNSNSNRNRRGGGGYQPSLPPSQEATKEVNNYEEDMELTATVNIIIIVSWLLIYNITPTSLSLNRPLTVTL